MRAESSGQLVFVRVTDNKDLPQKPQDVEAKTFNYRSPYTVIIFYDLEIIIIALINVDLKKKKKCHLAKVYIAQYNSNPLIYQPA